MIRLETITTWSIAWTTVKLAALCVLVLRILQWSQSTHSHWLIACAVVLGTRWLATCTVVQRQGHGSLHVFQQVKKRTQSACQESASGSVSTASHTCKLRRQHEDRDAWRKLVGSEPVAAAWDKLCNSIIQEFIYDSWFSQLSPDREFPAEVRWLLNHTFGQFSKRAQRIDWTPLLVRSCSSAVNRALQLYREVENTIGGAHLASLSAAEADAAVHNALVDSQKLHPAFATAEGQYKTCRHLAELVLTQVLPAEDKACDIVRTMLRELLSTCLIRSILASLAPYNVNKILLSVLQGNPRVVQPTPEQQKAAAEHEDKALESCRAEFIYMQRQHLVSDSWCKDKAQPSPSYPPEIESWHGIKRSKSVGDIKHMVTASTLCPTVAPATASTSASHTTMSPAHKPSPGKWRDAGSGMQGPQKLLGGVGAVKAAAQNLVLRSKASCDVRLASPKLSHSGLDRTTGSLVSCKGSVSSAASTIGARKAAYAALGGLKPSAYNNRSYTHCFAANCVRLHGTQQELLAQVVNAELFDLDGKDCIVYRIQVVQCGTEWTVTRRYRHFEALHKRLKDLPCYEQAASLLPPKQPLTARDAPFVLKRREELNGYLQALLQNPFTARDPELLEFVSQYSYKYGIAAAADAGQDVKSLTGQIMPGSTTKSFYKDAGMFEASSSSSNVMLHQQMRQLCLEQQGTTLNSGAAAYVPSCHSSPGSGSREAPMTGVGLSAPAYCLGGSFSSQQEKQCDDHGAAFITTDCLLQSRTSPRQHSSSSSVFAGAVAAAHVAAGTALNTQLLMLQQPEVTRSVLASAPLQAGRTCNTQQGHLQQEQQQPVLQSPSQWEQQPDDFQSVSQQDSTDVVCCRQQEDKILSMPDSPPVPNKILPQMSLLVDTTTPITAQRAATDLAACEGKKLETSCSRRRCTGPHACTAAGQSRLGGSFANGSGCVEAASGRHALLNSGGQVSCQSNNHIWDRQHSAYQSSSFLSGNSTEAEPSHMVTAGTDAMAMHKSTNHGLHTQCGQYSDSNPGQEDKASASSMDTEQQVAISQGLESPSSPAVAATMHSAMQSGLANVSARRQQVFCRGFGDCTDTAVQKGSGMGDLHLAEAEAAGDLPLLGHNTGLIEPLCELLSTLFEVKASSFVRRPVMSMVRQLLYLLAGGAVDEFLQRTLSTGLSADIISRQLSRLHRQLFPGGVWFARAAATAAATAGGPQPNITRAPPVDITKYLDWVPPADCDAVAEQLRQQLFAYSFPATMVAVVGRTAVNKALSDCYGVLQSKTLMYNMGLTVMEAVLEAMFPEIKVSVKQMHKTLLS